MSEGRTVNGEWAGGPVRWREFQIDVSQVQAKQLWLLKCENPPRYTSWWFQPI